MKKLILFLALGLMAWMPQARATTAVATMDQTVAGLQRQWAVIEYQTPDKARQEKAIAGLAAQAAQASRDNPGKAEPLIWQAIIISTKAGLDGGIGALGEVRQECDLLLQAEKINPQALNGSIYTSLGSLYYKVPSWPLGFGDNKKAKQYLEKALTLNPDGTDPNFFYGELLYETGDYTRAKSVLEHGLKAPPVPGRELADKGRRGEIQELLRKVNKKLS